MRRDGVIQDLPARGRRPTIAVGYQGARDAESGRGAAARIHSTRDIHDPDERDEQYRCTAGFDEGFINEELARSCRSAPDCASSTRLTESPKRFGATVSRPAVHQRSAPVFPND